MIFINIDINKNYKPANSFRKFIISWFNKTTHNCLNKTIATTLLKNQIQIFKIIIYSVCLKIPIFKMQGRIRTAKVVAAVMRLAKCKVGVDVYDVTESVVRESDTASRAKVRAVLEEAVVRGLLRKSSSRYDLVVVTSPEGSGRIRSMRKWTKAGRTRTAKKRTPRFHDLTYLEVKPRNTQRLVRTSKSTWHRASCHKIFLK